jgi:hypothetical protein
LLDKGRLFERMRMIDLNGVPIKLGQQLQLLNNDSGIVVCDLDNDDYAPDYIRANWGYLKSGILVFSEKVGLIHYQQKDVDLEKLIIKEI